ncbi:MAG: glycosyltransferase family protein, partial [Chitinophagaceae bacterium]
VRYRSEGLTLFYNDGGGLDYKKVIRNLNPFRIWKEVKELPVEKYDVVVNDFECITSLACALKKVPSVNFGHQASFQSALTPRPAQKDAVGEIILKYFARATNYLGLHFEKYDDFIFTPVIKKEILQAKPVKKNHITIYLPSYSDRALLKYLNALHDCSFQVFSKELKQPVICGNTSLIPISNRLFTESMINSRAVITGAGFETPAEALHLQKKLMVIPIRGQYEQLCNGAALERLGVKSLSTMDESFGQSFYEWIESDTQTQLTYDNVAPGLVNRLLENYPYKGSAMDLLYPNFIFN